MANRKYKGVSVIIRNKEQLDELKKLIGIKYVYLDWVPQMATRLTAVVVESKHKEFFIGSAGCAEYQGKEGFKIIELDEFLTQL